MRWLAAGVTDSTSGPPSPMSLSLPLASPAVRRPLRRRSFLLGVLALAIAALALAAWWGTGRTSGRPSGRSWAAVWLVTVAASGAATGSVAIAVAFLRQRRLVRTLQAIRNAGAAPGDAPARLARLVGAARTSLGADGLRLDLRIDPDVARRGTWTSGVVPPAAGPGLLHETARVGRGGRTLGTIETWSEPGRLGRMTRLAGPARRVTGHRDLLLAASDAIAAELEIAGLVEQLAQETRDHGRSRRQDPLTRLLNRSAFIDEVDRRTAVGAAGGASRVALVAVLDVNRFTEINATLGHELGDAVLREVADRVVAALPAGSVVARTVATSSACS